MLWEEFLLQQLKHDTAIDKLYISIRDDYLTGVPEILKASILVADKLLETGNMNMIVFPERQISSYMFMLFKTIFNISEGRTDADYNPYTFVPGEKLKFRNCFMEFVEVRVDDGVERIYVKFAEGMKYGVPLEVAPYLQRAQSKLLSKFASYQKVFTPFITEQNQRESESLIQNLADLKTHLGSSSVFVSSIIKTKAMLHETKLNGVNLTKFLLLSQSNSDGKIKNLTAGQLSGNPALVLCPDLYAVNEIIKNGLSVSNVFMEANQNALDNQLDALDDLIKTRKTIFLLTDQVSYNEYSNLEARGFRIWTWNDTNITEVLYSNLKTQVNVRVRNAAKKNIEYIDITHPEISTIFNLLYKYKAHIEDKSSAVIQVFQDLFEISLLMLRAITPITNSAYLLDVVNKCELTLNIEKPYMDESMFLDFMTIANSIRVLCKNDVVLPKVEEFEILLSNSGRQHLLIVIPQKKSKNTIEQYLANVSGIDDVEYLVLYPNEYLLHTEAMDSLTVISGWLGKSIMGRMLTSHITADIKVLLYDCEKRWKNGYIRSNIEYERNAVKNNANVLSYINKKINTSIIYESETHQSIVSEMDSFSDIDDIELTLRQNRYKGYIASPIEDSVEAVPVSFVGDIMAFYRTSRKLLTATKIINEDGDSTEEIVPDNLLVGDFIIERETQRNLIRDIADKILKNSNCSELRKISSMWKDALKIAINFTGEDDLFKKLQAAGCKRGKPAFRNWLYSDTHISPQSKDDIIYIAKATDDAVLMEIVDKVFDAGRQVKSAHIAAGHYLAEKLRSNLSSSLTLMESIDGFNVWEPIDMDIEDIGNIKILKVIDVGDKVMVDVANTNRLIDTNRVTA